MSAGHQRMLQDHPEQTFLFEYISWNDKHVVEYTKQEQNIYLIGTRDILTGRLAPYRELETYVAQSLRQSEARMSFNVRIHERRTQWQKKC